MPVRSEAWPAINKALLISDTLIFLIYRNIVQYLYILLFLTLTGIIHHDTPRVVPHRSTVRPTPRNHHNQTKKDPVALLSFLSYSQASKRIRMSTKDLFGDDSSDDDDEVQDELPKKPEAGEAKKKSEDDDDDDDDDEGAAEFDGTGAVVGLQSTTIAGAKLSEDAMDTAEDGGDTLAAPSPKKPPPLKIVHQQDLKVPATTALPPHVSVHVTKLPNLMGIQTQPFDTSTYFPSLEDDEFGPMAASLVRWRYADKDDKGEDAPIESNSRLVEWEDGSWTLHIGAEAFEVDLKDRSKKDFPGFNGYLYQSHQAQMDTADNTATVLECVAPVASRMTVHPSSLQSAAHKSLTVAVRQKTLKSARIATIATQDDPELQKQERIRASQDVHKQQQKRGGGGIGGGGGGRRRPRMSRGYLEDDYDDDAYDTTNIKGMKRKVREGEDMDDFIEDDDDDDMGRDTLRSKRSKRRQDAKEEEEDEEEEEEEEEIVMGGDDDDDEDEEDEAAPRVHKKKGEKKPPSRNVFDDDDDDDEE